jgi:hypothetical protein
MYLIRAETSVRSNAPSALTSAADDITEQLQEDLLIVAPPAMLTS